MRITVELPDDLLRRIKIHAAMTDQKLKVLMPKLLDAGLADLERAAAIPPARTTARSRRKPRRVGAASRTTLRRH